MSGRPTRSSPLRRAGQVLARGSERAAGHRIILGLIVAAVGGFLAYIAWVSVNGVPFQDRYKLDVVISADSPVVKPGGTVRMAGKLAGTITDVGPDGENERVSIELRPEFAPVGRDATAQVRVRSVVYLTYIEIDPGNRDDPMPEGNTIELAQTGSGVDLLEVVQVFDERTRDLLRKSLVNTGQGLAGRGEDLNEGLAGVRPILEQGVPELRALTRDPGALGDSIASAAAVSSGLTGTQADDVSALLDSGDRAVGAIASRHQDLGEAVERLRPFEDEVLRTAPLADPLLEDAGDLTEELAPVARDLERGLPKLNRLLGLGDPLRTESERLAQAALPSLRLAGPRLYELYTGVNSIEPILTSLKLTLDVVLPYADEITQAGANVASATGVAYGEGQTAPGNPALRFIPAIGCAKARNPYPAPGQAQKDSAGC